MKKIVLMLLIVFSSIAFSQTLFLEENFDYGNSANSNITAVTSNWILHSGAQGPQYNTSGLSYVNYPSPNIGGDLGFTKGSSGVTDGDVDRVLSSSVSMTSTVYTSFLLSLSAVTSTGDYFFHLGPASIGITFRARVYAKRSGGGFVFGLAKSSETATYDNAHVLNLNTTYLVVVKYWFSTSAINDDQVTMYVYDTGVPSSEPGTPLVTIGPLGTGVTSDPANIGCVAIRQGTNTPTGTIDGIRVSDSWFVLLSSPPVATPASNVTAASFDASWNAVNGASGYKIDVATDNNFSNILALYNNLDVGNVITKLITGLMPGVIYYYRIRAYNSSNESGLNSNVRTNVEISLAGTEAAALTYTEGDLPTQLTATTTVTANLTNLDAATIQITGNYQNGADILRFTNPGPGGITGTWDASTGTMTLIGTTTVANYQTALRSITFQNTSQNPSTLQRTVSFAVNGSLINSVTITRDISVTAINNAPVLTGIEVPNLNYTEGEGSKQITFSLTANDVDNTTLQNAVVQITGNYINGEDVLTFANQNSITGMWAAGTGTLNLSGVSSVTNYRAALQSVGYQNNSQNPSTAVRTISFTVNDGALNSNTETRSVSVTAVNNPPTLSSIEMSPLSYPIGNPSVEITQTIVLSDLDNANMTSAEVKIAGHYKNGNDILGFTNPGLGGITCIWDATTGTMMLTGAATIANYQSALRSVTYLHTQTATPDKYTRTITFKANDGIADGNVEHRDINLGNTPPVLAGIETTPLEFKQGDNPKVVTNMITVTDEGIPNLQSAIIWISDNYKNGDDVLSFTNQNGIVGTWYQAQGALVLNLGSSVSNYEAALRSVTYNNVSSKPGMLPKTVSLKVADMYMESNVVSRTINITPVYTVTLVNEPNTGGTATGAGTFDFGTAVTVTATPNAGYLFVNWTEDGKEVSTSVSYAFTITSDRTLTANFTLQKCTLATISNPTSGGTTTGDGTFDYGTSVTVTATPNQGYEFVNWTSNGTSVSTSASYTFIINGNLNLVANFMMLPVLTVTPNFITVDHAAGTGSFTVTNSGGGTMHWTAVSDIFWIKIKSGATGTNNGTINFSYNHNNSAARIGTITITATGVSGSSKAVEIRQGELATFVETLNMGIPDDFKLDQNYPNPFNPSTTISYKLSSNGNVSLKAYDILGNEVATLMNGFQNAGSYKISFDASPLASGVYFYKLRTSNFVQVRKMLLLK